MGEVSKYVMHQHICVRVHTYVNKNIYIYVFMYTHTYIYSIVRRGGVYLSEGFRGLEGFPELLLVLHFRFRYTHRHDNYSTITFRY